MKRTFIAGVSALSILLAGCSSSDESTAEQVVESAAPSEIASTTAAAADARDYPIIGEEARSDGIAITVRSLEEVQSIRVNDSGYVGDSAVFTDRTARSGGKFVVVDTTVFNDSLRPIDITCAAPIQNTLTTDDQRQYTTVDEQYKIEGNPGCNDELQPGFDAQMKFVYEIPVAGVPVAFGFSDRQTSYDKPTYIELITS